MQKELLPTPILTAAQGEGAKENLPAWKRAGLPEAKQFPAQNKTPGTVMCQNSQHRDVAFPAPNPWVQQPQAEDGYWAWS